MLFSDLNLNKPLLNALEDLGLTNPTSIQSKVFSVIMSGKDMVGVAHTGTGKTYAYLLPLLRMWKYAKHKLPQILILVPTRELVMQVVNATEELTQYMSFDVVGVYGGVNMKNQAAELMEGCDMIVATPGRFIDLAATGVLKVKNIRKLVVDEFDMMLDLGFKPQLDLIFDKIPERRQSLLFSATISSEITDLVTELFIAPEIIEDTEKTLDSIYQKAYFIPNFKTKINFLEALLGNDQEMQRNLIFTSQKSSADYLFEQLQQRGFEAIDVIHSNKSQNYRFRVVQEFSEGKIRSLISTDIGSRGLDFPEVTHVVNMDMPETPDDYVHRIGRTGRAGDEGVAISFVSPMEEEIFAEIQKLYDSEIQTLSIPSTIEVEDTLMDFETEREVFKFPEFKPDKQKGDAFHERAERNRKVNIKRDIEAEKKLKYGKSYKRKRT